MRYSLCKRRSNFEKLPGRDPWVQSKAHLQKGEKESLVLVRSKKISLRYSLNVGNVFDLVRGDQLQWQAGLQESHYAKREGTEAQERLLAEAPREVSSFSSGNGGKGDHQECWKGSGSQ